MESLRYLMKASNSSEYIWNIIKRHLMKSSRFWDGLDPLLKVQEINKGPAFQFEQAQLILIKLSAEEKMPSFKRSMGHSARNLFLPSIKSDELFQREGMHWKVVFLCEF